MLKIAGQFRRLIAICVAAPGGRFSLLLFAVVLGLNLSSIYLTLRLVKWTGEFYSAVEKLNGQEALRQIGIFALIIATTALRGLVSQYLRKRLELRWRRDLTNAAIERWMVSSRRNTLGQRGATSTRSSKPMVFMARAAAPTLPAWLVWISMKRVRMVKSKRNGGPPGHAPLSPLAMRVCPERASVCPEPQVAPCAPGSERSRKALLQPLARCALTALSRR